MLVSCLMATRDRRRFVPEAVAAFEAQTLSDSELIVVDDGEDSVLDLVPVGNRFRYVQLAGRHHFCALRDVALSFARGHYVAVWDDDDLPAPDRLAVQVEALERAGGGLCLLASSVVWREEPEGTWVYTPTDPFMLDNTAVFSRRAGFSFRGEGLAGAAVNALRADFPGQPVLVRDRPELLVTRRHGANTCARACGCGPEWAAVGRQSHLAGRAALDSRLA